MYGRIIVLFMLMDFYHCCRFRTKELWQWAYYGFRINTAKKRQAYLYLRILLHAELIDQVVDHVKAQEG
jgi:hypothetical protein